MALHLPLPLNDIFQDSHYHLFNPNLFFFYFLQTPTRVTLSPPHSFINPSVGKVWHLFGVWVLIDRIETLFWLLSLSSRPRGVASVSPIWLLLPLAVLRSLGFIRPTVYLLRHVSISITLHLERCPPTYGSFCGLWVDLWITSLIDFRSDSGHPF